MDKSSGVMNRKHLVVDATPGKRPSVLVWGLTDDAEIKRVIALYRANYPHQATVAILAADWGAFESAHR
jgi:hypothetical protein